MRQRSRALSPGILAVLAVAAALSFCCGGTVHASDDNVGPRQDPAVLALIHTVGLNEYNALRARDRDLMNGNGRRYFFYEQERSAHTGQHLWSQAVVETSAGPLERLLAVDGKPLDAAAQRTEDARITDLASHPDKIKAAQSAKMADRKRSEAMFTTPPEMYLFTRQSAPEGAIALSFAPNPSYTPQTYQQRVLHALTGVVRADARSMRMSQLDAKVAERVEFGWGLLGVVQQGGTLRMVRQDVGGGDWRLTGLDIHIAGRMLLFKSLDMDEYLARRDFLLLPAQDSMQDDLKRLLAAKL
jgi:hypothetical protein